MAELYALLEKQDGANAKMVLEDLGDMWEWTKVDFLGSLEGMDERFERVKRANYTVKRDAEWRDICW